MVSVQVYEGVGITLIIFTAAFVFLRCLTSIRSLNRLNAGDYLSIVAFLCTTASFITNDFNIRVLGSPAGDTFYDMQVTFTSVILVVLALWTTKASILFVYIQLFGIRKWVTYSSWTAIVVTGLLYIGTFCVTAARCPLSRPEEVGEWQTSCVNGAVITGVASGLLSIIADVIIFCLPIPIIYHLKMKPSRKVAVGGVFFSGTIATIASIVSLYYKWEALDAKGTEFGAPIICNTIECTIATMVGCAPAAKAFWKNYISKRGRANTTSAPTSNIGTSRRGNIFSGSNTKLVNDVGSAEGSYVMIDDPSRSMVKNNNFQ